MSETETETTATETPQATETTTGVEREPDFIEAGYELHPSEAEPEVKSDSAQPGDEAGTEGEGAADEKIPAEPEKGIPGTSVAQPVFDEPILQRARTLGLSRIEARAFPNREALEMALDVMESRMSTQGAPGQQAGQQGAKQPVVGYKCSLKDKDKDFDDNLVNEFDTISRHFESLLDERINTLSHSLNQVALRLIEKDVASETSWMDEKFNSLGDEWTESLGKGTFNTIDRNSAQFRNRSDIAVQMQAIRTAYEQSGQRPPSKDEMFERARRAVLGDQIEKAVRKNIAASIDKRKTMSTSRAVPKKGADTNLSADERAIKAVAEKLKEFTED
jgi:hypothetical protein